MLLHTRLENSSSSHNGGKQKALWLFKTIKTIFTTILFWFLLNHFIFIQKLVHSVNLRRTTCWIWLLIDLLFIIIIIIIIINITRCLCELSSRAAGHILLTQVFSSRPDYVTRVFHRSLHLITFGGRLAHLAYHMHKSGHNTATILHFHYQADENLPSIPSWWWWLCLTPSRTSPARLLTVCS